jgi:hypothetical protein
LRNETVHETGSSPVFEAYVNDLRGEAELVTAAKGDA